jgi:hypothetical protein
MNPLSNSRRLRQRIEPALPELAATTTQMVLRPDFRELYPEWMVTVHQMIRATVPLMRAALRRCRELAAGDAVAAAMVPYLARHVEEELHHDDWLLEDLESLGVPRAAVLRRVPPPTVASLIGAQYYWIHHHHPVAKLGQIAVMEGYPPGVEAIDLLAARTGYPRAAFRTLERHCHLDARHRDQFDEALDRMPLREEHHAVLEVSALHVVRLAAAAYREVVERADEADRTTRQPPLPRRRPDLVARQGNDNGTYRLEDTLGGVAYQLGEQEYFLLTRCDGRTTRATVRRAFAERFGEPLTEAELDEFLRLAVAEQLVVAGPGTAAEPVKGPGSEGRP